MTIHRAFRRGLGDRVVVTHGHETYPGTVTKIGRVGFYVTLDDGTQVWRHQHEVYDPDDTEDQA